MPPGWDLGERSISGVEGMFVLLHETIGCPSWQHDFPPMYRMNYGRSRVVRGRIECLPRSPSIYAVPSASVVSAPIRAMSIASESRITSAIVALRAFARLALSETSRYGSNGSRDPSRLIV